MKKKYNTSLMHKTKLLDRSKKKEFVPLSPSSGQSSEAIQFEPIRLVDEETQGRLKPGDRIMHKCKTGRSGYSIYNDEDTWKTKEN